MRLDMQSFLENTVEVRLDGYIRDYIIQLDTFLLVGLEITEKQLQAGRTVLKMQSNTYPEV